MDRSNKQIQFSWGKRRAKGGLKMDIRFYESFTLDNVKYSLYDCVYLFKHGDPEPYIGKIVKIWEQNQAKKVKILWFFLPDEIQKYLRGSVMEKEIFLASGDGIGLADINPLEAVAGKCTVICISKDERNRQPSPREQAMADYIFYRFFNVENCTLSDQLPDKIAGLEVKVLLNPKDELVISSPNTVNVPLNPNADDGLAATAPPPHSAVKEENESPDAAVPLSQPAAKEVDAKLPAAVALSQSVVNKDQKPVAAIPISESVIKKEDKKSVAAISLSQSAVKEEEKSVAAISLSQSAVKEEEKPVASTPHPRSAVVENNAKHTQSQNVHDGERPPKKLKLSQEATLKNMTPAVTETRPFELPSRQAERSKWFTFTWDDKVRRADEQGTLVYIQNLDIHFAAADIEELIDKALQLSCTAKPINHPTYDDPNNGKAYAIFKTKNDADVAISKINSGLVVGGRPLYCSKGLLKVPKSSGTFVGHLNLYNIKIGQKQREEQKKAVSTSHCSQPNTIEYDLALDWMLLRAKQEKKFQILHKRHKDDRKGFASIGSKGSKAGK